MSRINVLSEDVINRIAAGEVVQRPANVVKELVENAIDAGATVIHIDVKKSGKELIKISDNGSGMNKEDTHKSILRHATSKISTDDDLFSIQTLGFRGEALASIAAVSQLSIITKQEQELEGYNLVIEGGSIVSSGIIGATTGTTIEVRNLFFNTPARKKFLKTDAVELRHIIDVVTHYALCNKDISFKLNHEKHELLSSPRTSHARDTIASIYGATMAKELLDISYADETITIEGFIGKPFNALNNKNQQIFFVNGRWIKDSDLRKAVYEGYKSTLFVGKHPIFILHLTLDPMDIDVNIHPQKSEIKIDQKERIMKGITFAVNETLKKNNLIPQLDIDFSSSPQQKKNVKYEFDKGTQQVLEVKEEIPVVSSIESDPVANQIIEIEQKTVSKLPTFRLLGQIHKTFFVAETSGGVFFVDQHAAHERVMYEKYMNQFKDKKVEVQNLLQGEIIELSAMQYSLASENILQLKDLGFHLEPFGGNSFVLKTIPLVFNRIQSKEIIPDVLQTLNENRNDLEKFHDIIVTRMSCRSAVMAGDALTNHWMNSILEELGQCELPWTCPHGRPTIIETSADELEKKFKRK